MSTICLAAQRSYQTGEPVWFSYRLPRFKRLFGTTFLWILGLLAMVAAGLYAHVYWNMRHPAPEPKKVSVAKPETQLSDMHYVYVSKPFPQPTPPPVIKPLQEDVPPMQDMPINSDNSDWQQAPDGNVSHDRDVLPGTERQAEPPGSPDNTSSSLQEMFKQAIQDQQKDYSQGKVPAPPIDETQASGGD